MLEQRYDVEFMINNLWLERGTRIHILESRNRRAHGVDMLLAHIDMQIALSSESTLKSQ